MSEIISEKDISDWDKCKEHFNSLNGRKKVNDDTFMRMLLILYRVLEGDC